MTKKAFVIKEGYSFGRNRKHQGGDIIFLTEHEAAPLTHMLTPAPEFQRAEEKIETVRLLPQEPTVWDVLSNTFGGKLARVFFDNDITSLVAIKAMTDQELLKLKGIGESRVATIREKVGYAGDNIQIVALKEELGEATVDDILDDLAAEV